jgi:hypothetical protein
VEQIAADAADMEQLVIQGVYPSALLNVVAAALVVLVAVTFPLEDTLLLAIELVPRGCGILGGSKLG